MGLKRSDVFKSKYLSKDDLHTPLVLTVKDVAMQTVQNEDGNDDVPVMEFREDVKPMIVKNQTNWSNLEEAFGDDTDNWIGKKIEVYVDPNVMFKGKKTGGVRIRIPTGAMNPGVQATPTKLFGNEAANKLTNALQTKGLNLADLRDYLTVTFPQFSQRLALEVPSWPGDVMQVVGAWIANPPPKPSPIGDGDDIPFDFGPTVR